MYCPDCGHQNPERNKYCGMCGVRLPLRSASMPPATPRTAEMGADDPVRTAAEHSPDPVFVGARLTAAEEARVRPLAPEIPPLYDTHSVWEAPTDRPTTLSGPSFLGLGVDSSSNYSNLYDDDQPASPMASILLLVVLAALAGAIYWNWQPLRAFVMDQVNSRLHVQATPPAVAPTEPAGTSSPSSNSATPPSQPANPPGPTPQDNAADPSAGAPEPAAAASGQKDAGADKITASHNSDRPRSEVGRASRFQGVKGKSTDASETEASTQPAARRTIATPAGGELVDAGEKNLYGRGVRQNCNQALADFKAAARADNPRAMSHLGALYSTGQCVPLDRVQAYQWFSRALAVDNANKYLEHNLTMLWREMSSIERAKATQKQAF